MNSWIACFMLAEKISPISKKKKVAARSFSWLDDFVSGPSELHSHWMIHVWYLGALEIFSTERVELLN